MEPPLSALMEALESLKIEVVEHRTESRLRWDNVADRLDEHAKKLDVIPVMQHQLDLNTSLTAALTERKAFWDGAKRRWIGLGMFAGASAAIVGLGVAIKNLLQNGTGPHP